MKQWVWHCIYQSELGFVYKPILSVFCIIDVFHHNMESAKDLSATIHSAGSGIAGTYDFEIAEQKALEATGMSRNSKFPLVVKLEPVD